MRVSEEERNDFTEAFHWTYSKPTSPGRVPSRSLGRGEKGNDFDISFFGDFPSSSHRPAATRVVCRCVVDGMGANADATARVHASENAANFMVAFVRCRVQTDVSWRVVIMTRQRNTKGSALMEH
jgi:hypothetical protein